MSTQATEVEDDKADSYRALFQKMEPLVQFQRPYIRNILRKLGSIHPDNANLICDYILGEQTEFNIKESTKEAKMKALVWLSNHFTHKKSFKAMTKGDILSYLNSLRKPITEDPSQRWIGSYNGRQLVFSSFFRWLYDGDEHDPRKRLTPPCLTGIRRLPRKEKTPYKPSDLFTARNNEVFLKYCPSKRDRCFHAMAIDTSCRPHELLNLKIRDIVFKLTDEKKQYAEITIKGGKTPRPRTVPLINSIPYVKEWISTQHPTGTNADSWLFVSLSKNAFGSKLTYDGLYNHYIDYYKSKYFPGLLEKDDGSVPEADKSIIRDILPKPWALYNLRHSSLTEKSLILKEHVLRDHAGWTMTSKMPQIYIHYFGNESSKSILQAMGVIKEKDANKSFILKTRICPNCAESNKPESRWCIKCKMVLSYDAYAETVEEKQLKENRIEILENQMQSLMESNKEILECLKHPDKIIRISQED